MHFCFTHWDSLFLFHDIYNYVVQFLSVSDFLRNFCFSFLGQSYYDPMIYLVWLLLLYVDVLLNYSVYGPLWCTSEHCVFVILDNVFHKVKLGQDNSKCSRGFPFTPWHLGHLFWLLVIKKISVWSGRLVCFRLRINRFLTYVFWENDLNCI